MKKVTKKRTRATPGAVAGIDRLTDLVQKRRSAATETDLLKANVAVQIAEINAISRRCGRWTDYYAPPGSEERYISFLVTMAHLAALSPELHAATLSRLVAEIVAVPCSARGTA